MTDLTAMRLDELDEFAAEVHAYLGTPGVEIAYSAQPDPLPEHGTNSDDDTRVD